MSLRKFVSAVIHYLRSEITDVALLFFALEEAIIRSAGGDIRCIWGAAISPISQSPNLRERRLAMATSLITRRPGVLSNWRRDPISALRDEMNELRTRLWGDEDESWLAGTPVPSLDMTESDHALEIRMDVPGVKAKDIDIQLNGNILTIRGQRDEEQEEKGKTYHRIERRTGSFSRVLTLPCAVSQDEVVADYRDGVLNVTLPKSEESKAHKIKVKG